MSPCLPHLSNHSPTHPLTHSPTHPLSYSILHTPYSLNIPLKTKLFINQDSGYLMIDIVNAHVKAGFECALITGRLIQRNIPLHPSVKVDHIISYKRDSNFKRLFTWLLGSVQILFKIVLKYSKAELFIVSNPPLAPLLPLWVKNPFSLLIFDIYPDALVSSHIVVESSFITKWWKNANKKVYPKARTIYTLTEKMGEVIQQYTKGEKPVIVPVWTDSAFLKPVAKEENPFLKRHGLQGKFIVMYSGNLGYTHNVEVIAEIAAGIQNPDILFLIIGEGDSKDSLLAKIKELELTNCLLLPWQPTTELPYSLAAADLAIVSSGGGASNLSIPSKTFNLMSVGAPLLCLAPSGSELEQLVEKNKNGRCFSHEKTDDIVSYIEEVATNSEYRKTLVDNSLKASKAYTSENAGRFLE